MERSKCPWFRFEITSDFVLLTVLLHGCVIVNSTGTSWPAALGGKRRSYNFCLILLVISPTFDDGQHGFTIVIVGSNLFFLSPRPFSTADFLSRKKPDPAKSRQLSNRVTGHLINAYGITVLCVSSVIQHIGHYLTNSHIYTIICFRMLRALRPK